MFRWPSAAAGGPLTAQGLGRAPQHRKGHQAAAPWRRWQSERMQYCYVFSAPRLLDCFLLPGINRCHDVRKGRVEQPG